MSTFFLSAAYVSTYPCSLPVLKHKSSKLVHFWACDFSLHLGKVWVRVFALSDWGSLPSIKKKLLSNNNQYKVSQKQWGQRKKKSFHVNYSHVLQLSLRSYKTLQTQIFGTGQIKNYIWPTNIFQTHSYPYFWIILFLYYSILI